MMSLKEEFDSVFTALPPHAAVLAPPSSIEIPDLYVWHASVVMDSVEVLTMQFDRKNANLLVLNQIVCESSEIAIRYDLYTLLVPEGVGIDLFFDPAGSMIPMAQLESHNEEQAMSLLVPCMSRTFSMTRLHVCKHDPRRWKIVVKAININPISVCRGSHPEPRRPFSGKDMIIFGLEGLYPQAQA